MADAPVIRFPQFGAPPTRERGPECASATRTVQAGGAFMDMLLHPDFVPFERTFRRLPTNGLFTATPERPVTLEIGAYTVPQNMSLLIAEYGYTIYRFNGAIPGDYLPLESGRLALSMGTDLNFMQYRKGNIAFEIIPVPAPTQNQDAFTQQPSGGTIFPPSLQNLSFGQPSVGTIQTLYNSVGVPNGAVPGQVQQASAPPSAFQQVRSAVQTVGAGSALQPSRPREQQGPQKFPFSYIIDENNSVQTKMSFFGPVNIPVAFIEGRISGYLLGANIMQALLDGVKPCA